MPGKSQDLTDSVDNEIKYSVSTNYIERKNQKRIASIDIIKGIAMIMVILVHYNQD